MTEDFFCRDLEFIIDNMNPVLTKYYCSSINDYKDCLGVLAKVCCDISKKINFAYKNNREIDCRVVEKDNMKIVVYPKSLQEALSTLINVGYSSISIPEVYGGLNFPSIISIVASEMLARADASLSVNFLLSNGVAETLCEFADEDVKKEYIPKLVNGELTGAMALTESKAGSDLGAIKTKGYEKNGKWYISGEKIFITNGVGTDFVLNKPIGYVSLVLAGSEDTGGTKGLSLFLVPRNEKTVLISLEDKMGLHMSPTCQISYEDAPAYLIGKRGEGLKNMLYLMNMARVGVSAQAIGIAQAALSSAKEYAETREQFGMPINKFPAVQKLIVDGEIGLEACRALLYYTIELIDIKNSMAKLNLNVEPHNKLILLLTPLTKLYATELAEKVTSDALQVLGGYGYVKDFPLERYYRDQRITKIYEGTSEIQALTFLKFFEGVPDALNYLRLSKDIKTSAKFFYAQKFIYKNPESAINYAVFDIERILTSCDKRLAKGVKRSLTTTLKALSELSFVSIGGKKLPAFEKIFVIMFANTYAGALLLNQARASDRKRVVAKYFIDTMLVPNVEAGYLTIKSKNIDYSNKFLDIINEH